MPCPKRFCACSSNPRGVGRLRTDPCAKGFAPRLGRKNRNSDGPGAPELSPAESFISARRVTDMSSPSTHLTLLLLVDALRPDYVARAPALKGLAAASATGRLRECFGFVPRAAYF